MFAFGVNVGLVSAEPPATPHLAMAKPVRSEDQRSGRTDDRHNEGDGACLVIDAPIPARAASLRWSTAIYRKSYLLPQSGNQSPNGERE